MNTTSSLFLLMHEFNNQVHIPITEIGKKYFDLDEKQAKKKASENKYPFPVMRIGSQKSVWMVYIKDLADYLDATRDKAEQEYRISK